MERLGHCNSHHQFYGFLRRSCSSILSFVIFEKWVNMEAANLISSSAVKEICIAVQPQKWFSTELATYGKSSSQELSFLPGDHEALTGESWRFMKVIRILPLSQCTVLTGPLLFGTKILPAGKGSTHPPSSLQSSDFSPNDVIACKQN